MSMKTNISDLMAVGRSLVDGIDPKYEGMVTTPDEAILRENGSPRQSPRKKESRSDPLGLDIENDAEAQEGSESENQCDRDKKKRRRRRVKGGKHHKKWKPYEKLNWNERRKLEEKESQRANQRREEAFAHGHPVAPYNTTQFLMEDRDDHENVQRNNSRESNDGSGSGTESSEESFSSPDETESDFMEKEFAETYDNFHAERLQKMSKDELIKDYIEMETKLERLQRRMDRRKSKQRDSSASLSSSGEEFIDVDKLRRQEQELQQLKKENNQLKSELDKKADDMVS